MEIARKSNFRHNYLVQKVLLLGELSYNIKKGTVVSFLTGIPSNDAPTYIILSLLAELISANVF